MYLTNPSLRCKELFSFGWEFRHGDMTQEEALAASFAPVDLPHDWSLSFPFDKGERTCGSGGYVVAGVGWYRKSFRVSPAARGRKTELHFEGAYMNSRVWLNGSFLGRHLYGYTPFTYDITDLLDYEGENTLLVRVDNSRQPGSRWYSGSGITRDVWLESVNPIHITRYGTCITTEGNVVRVRSQVEVPAAALEKDTPLSMEVELLCKGQTAARTEVPLAPAALAALDTRLTVENPALWSDREPNLYRCRLTLKANGQETDLQETAFGIRDIQWTVQDGFFLNGVRTKLNGVCLHHDGGMVGAAVPRKLWARRLDILKDLGVNAIRCSHNPPNTDLLDLCDEKGFLVMDEAFDEWEILKRKEFGTNKDDSKGYSEFFPQCHEEDITAMLLRDRNHPSIVIWSIGNEVPDQLTDEGWKLARKLKGIVNHYDPTRPVTVACDQIEAEPEKAKDSFLKELDVVGYNYVDRWRKRAETLYDDDRRSDPARIILGSENSTPGGLRGDFPLKARHFFDHPYYARPVQVSKVLGFTMTHDYVCGDFMWTGFDYLGESRWPHRSADFGIVDTAGFPKDSAYLYRSAWVEEPMVYAMPHWNMDVEEGTVLPVICYTNCDYADLYLNGKFYSRKKSNYAAYGMSQGWAHFETDRTPVTTNDMFLSWDVPYIPGRVEIIGYREGREAARYTMVTAGAPKKLRLTVEDGPLVSDGRDIGHVVIDVLDKDGNIVPTASDRITVTVTGAGTLLGLDNGDPGNLEGFYTGSLSALAGKLLAIVRAGREPGAIRLKAEADGLEGCEAEIEVK